MDYQANGDLREVLRAGYALMPLVASARASEPARIPVRVALPTFPKKIFQIRLLTVGYTVLRAQYGTGKSDCHVSSFEVSPDAYTSLVSLFDAMLKGKESFPSMNGGGARYYRPSMAFMAALQLTNESLYERVLACKTQTE